MLLLCEAGMPSCVLSDTANLPIASPICYREALLCLNSYNIAHIPLFMPEMTIEIVPAEKGDGENVAFCESPASEKADPAKSDDANLTRELIAEEQDAVNDYEKLSDEADSEEAKEVYGDIANEEKVHAGELLILLLKQDPAEKGARKQAHKESKDGSDDDSDDDSDDEEETVGESFRDMFEDGRKKVIAKAMGCDEEDFEKGTQVGRYSHKPKTHRSRLGKPIGNAKPDSPTIPQSEGPPSLYEQMLRSKEDYGKY